MANQRLGDAHPSGYGAMGSRFASDDFSRAQSGSETFDGISSRISQLIFTINKNSGELQRFQKRINTKDDNLQLRSKVHNVQQEAKTCASEVTSLLKKLHHVANSTDLQQKLQVERLTNSFKSTIERYDSIQKVVTDLMKTSSLQAGTQSFNEEQDTWSEEANLLEQQKRRDELHQQQLQIEDDISLAKEREQRIEQIESDILNVNEIFKELGAMVYEQGEVIDTIESNVTTAADNVEEGNVQLNQAVKYQKSYRKKLCVFAIIGIVVAGVLALILGLTLHKNK